MTKIILIYILLFFAWTSQAEMKLARINDKDGFTNIREGQGAEFKVITTIVTNEFFYCEQSNSEWLKVSVIKYTQKIQQYEGFIHKSKVEYIESLTDSLKRSIIFNIFDKQKLLADRFHKSDSTNYRIRVRELEDFSEQRYSPILPIFSKYFCKTNDVKLLNTLFLTIWADNGSANEMPSFTLGDCFICNSDLVIQQLNAIKNKKQRRLIIDDIDWGLHNHFDVPEEEIGIPNTADKKQTEEYKKFKKKLDTVK